jgi:hypothetical protein
MGPAARCAPTPTCGGSANGRDDRRCKLSYALDLRRRPAMRPSGGKSQGRGASRQMAAADKAIRLPKWQAAMREPARPAARVPRISRRRVDEPKKCFSLDKIRHEAVSLRKSALRKMSRARVCRAKAGKNQEKWGKTAENDRFFRNFPGDRVAETRDARMSDKRLSYGLNPGAPGFLRVSSVAEVRRPMDSGPTHQSRLFYRPRSTKVNERKIISDNSLRRGPPHAPRGARPLGGACEGWCVACTLPRGPCPVNGSRPSQPRQSTKNAKQGGAAAAPPAFVSSALFRGSTHLSVQHDI